MNHVIMAGNSGVLGKVCRGASIALLFMLGWLSAHVVSAQGPETKPFWGDDQLQTEGSVMFFPLQGKDTFTARQDACFQIPGTNFETLSVLPPPTDRPPLDHADLNLTLRGYETIDTHRGYIWLDGPTDVRAPQLYGLFADARLPEIVGTHQVYDWDWECNCRHQPLSRPEVTLVSVVTAPGETIHTPPSGYSLGGGYEVLVLYAQPDQVTLKYTREDNVVTGYTVHIEGICVEEKLLALYQKMDREGRAHLPALKAGEAFARALGPTIRIVIRDNGTFMDPRSLKDWWRQ